VTSLRRNATTDGKPLLSGLQMETEDCDGEGTGSGDDSFRIWHAGHLPSYVKTTLQNR